MNRWQRDVRAFQKAFKFAAPASLTLPTPELLYVRRRLVAEESVELVEAIGDGDLAKIAGECVDLIYVAIGTAVSCGIDLGPHWRAVHAANMRKILQEGNGKAQKPAGWVAPDHAAILTRAVVGRRWWNPRSWLRK